MRVETEHAVPHIIVVGNFHLVEKDNILEFRGISDCRAFSYDRAAAYEGALSHFRVLIDDAGTANISAVEYLSALCYPDILPSFLKPVLREPAAELYDEAADLTQNFPGILFPIKKILRDRLIKVKQIVDGKVFKVHSVFLSVSDL